MPNFTIVGVTFVGVTNLIHNSVCSLGDKVINLLLLLPGLYSNVLEKLREYCNFGTKEEEKKKRKKLNVRGVTSFQRKNGPH